MSRLDDMRRLSNEVLPGHEGVVTNSDLGAVFVVERGLLFQTGRPVTFPFLRNTEPAPKRTIQDFGQTLEPAGRYMNLDEDPDRAPLSRWEKGFVTFICPIVLEHGTTTSDPSGWKSRLSKAFGGKTGKSLSKAIVQRGYDGIVTVGAYGVSEIVDLTRLYTEERDR